MAGLIAYCTICGVAVAAYCGLSWVSFLIGGAVLTLISVLEQASYRPRLAAIGMTEILQITASASLGQSLLAALAAYALGMVARIMFGV